MIKKKLTTFARELRQNCTPVEKVLWQRLRNRQLLNCKFRRQEPVGKYIVDFICYEINLIIELDGGQHHWQTRYDNMRTIYLNKNNFHVLRYWNDEVALHLESVLEDIYREIEVKMLIKSPHPDPLPLSTRGRGRL